MIAALKAKGVPVLWVGLPAIRGTRTTGDMSYLDELYRARAEKAGIVYVDIWDGFVDENGRYAVQGPDFEGQIRRLRSSDGIHFTKAGAVKLAHYVEHELRRVMSNRILPVALPGPEEQSPGKAGALGARPAVGPVVPLGATGRRGRRSLGCRQPSGAGDIRSDRDARAQPWRRHRGARRPRRRFLLAARRHQCGNAGAGRSRAGPGRVDAPAAPAKGPAGKTDAKKPSEAKPNEAKPNEAKPKEAKSQPAPDAAPARPRRSRADLDGAPPRPPKDVGGGF